MRIARTISMHHLERAGRGLEALSHMPKNLGSCSSVHLVGRGMLQLVEEARCMELELHLRRDQSSSRLMVLLQTIVRCPQNLAEVDLRLVLQVMETNGLQYRLTTPYYCSLPG